MSRISNTPRSPLRENSKIKASATHRPVSREVKPATTHRTVDEFERAKIGRANEVMRARGDNVTARNVGRISAAHAKPRKPHSLGGSSTVQPRPVSPFGTRRT